MRFPLRLDFSRWHSLSTFDPRTDIPRSRVPSSVPGPQRPELQPALLPPRVCDMVAPESVGDRTMAEASYVQVYRDGRLKERAAEAEGRLANCRLCPRNCGVDRLDGALGFCRTGARALVSSANPHFGEEAPLVGRRGSGTIFFARCNLLCSFCQNADISHGGAGEETAAAELADLMVGLQAVGCHNVNLVTPSHVVPQILAALLLAIPRGLRVPLVYNSGG